MSGFTIVEGNHLRYHVTVNEVKRMIRRPSFQQHWNITEFPKTFSRCLICNEEYPLYIRCCRNDGCTPLSKAYEEQSAEVLAQYLREQFGTNVELPFCSTRCIRREPLVAHKDAPLDLRLQVAGVNQAELPT